MMISRLLKFPFYIFAAVLIFSFTNTTIPHITDANIVEDILHYVNLHRKSIGLKPLQLNEVESSLAEKHSMDMASGRVPFGHDGLQDRAKSIRRQLGAITSVGENVASGPMTAKEAVDGWLHSPGHKRNIEGDFTLTGIGYAKGKDGIIYFTQIFSK